MTSLWLVSGVHSIFITKFRRTPYKNKCLHVGTTKLIINFWGTKWKVCLPFYNKWDFLDKWSQANLKKQKKENIYLLLYLHSKIDKGGLQIQVPWSHQILLKLYPGWSCMSTLQQYWRAWTEHIMTVSGILFTSAEFGSSLLLCTLCCRTNVSSSAGRFGNSGGELSSGLFLPALFRTTIWTDFQWE